MPKLTKQQYLDLYYFMQLNRLLEERLTNLYRQTKVIGGLFRSLGQEATSVGSAYALEPSDMLSPLIRNLGSILVKGVKPREVLCQYMAKLDGPTRGKDLNIHFGDLSRGFVGPISMLGDMIPVMAGVALSMRMQKKNIVCLVYIGDGGTSTGAFHEGMNFIAVQNLPVIVVAENNAYAYSTPTSKQMAVKDLAEKAKGYGMRAEIVDGNNVIEVYEATRKAVERARKGGGPAMIEAKTFRMKGHAEHDNQAYVPKEVIEAWRKKDPIDCYQKFLVKERKATEQELEEIVARISRELDEDVAFAEASPLPSPEIALEDVYADFKIRSPKITALSGEPAEHS